MLRHPIILATLVLAVAGGTVLATACGDDCPDGFVVVDDAACVPESISGHCHFVGSSEPGETCSATADCRGCFVACLQGACFEQRLAGQRCERDLECRSGSCIDTICADL